jgi:hypothetical protein
MVAGIATAVDITVFWSTFLSQLYFRDRNKDNKMVSEYLALGAILELSYIPLRFTAQYALQQNEWDPATSSAISQTFLVSLYTAMLPPIRYGLHRMCSKR